MSFFHHPNPAKLAANNDLRGLVECVTGKDAAVAKAYGPPPEYPHTANRSPAAASSAARNSG